MSLIEHLTELRTRLIRCVIAVVLGAIAVWVFFDPIFDFLSEPYCSLRSDDVSVLIAELELGDAEAAALEDADCNFLMTRPLEGFSVQLTMSGYGGLILALPVILYQIGRFVLPGLYPHEKKAVLPFFAMSVILLFAGMTLGYLFLPRALEVLTTEFGSDRFQAFFSPQEYLDFFVKMVLAFGLAFELPLILVFLQLTGLVQTATLRRNRRVAIVLVVIAAAIITPTGDPFTLGALGIPMYVFYELSLIIGGRMTKKRQLAQA
ncbi:MAG: twin-arginine translocase subunit TatC [Acidimicrobiales bacterium]